MLLNVRLGPKEERIVRGLKRRKINVSALVRRELVAAGTALLARQSGGDVEIVERILTEIPAKPKRRPPLDDRRAVRDFIRKKLARR